LLHGMVVQERDTPLDGAALPADSCSAVWALIAALSRSSTP
jgi:hypothetical protein